MTGMQMTFGRVRWPALLLSAALMALVGGGCDAADDEAVILTTEETFFFSFDADDVSDGAPLSLVSEGRADLGPFLSSRGFTKAEITTVLVASARLEVLRPINENVDVLGSVILEVEAEGADREVAQQARLSAGDDDVELEVLPNRNIATFVRNGDFGAIVTIEPRDPTPGETYELGVVMNLRIELEGL